jgi:pyruvate carboxylase
MMTHRAAMKKFRKPLFANCGGLSADAQGKPGQSVKGGCPLLHTEAIKMKSVITAERDRTMAGIRVIMGDKIDAEDLLLEPK